MPLRLRFLAALLAVLPLVPPVVAGEARAQTRDRVRVVGSSTVYPFAATVAEALGRAGRVRTPVIESTGTGGGLKLFCAGLGPAYPDVADASRPMTALERAQCAGNGVAEVAELKIGLDGIVLATSRRAPPLALTRAELWRALARRVPRDGALVANPNRLWSDIDARLPARPIQVLGPPPTSGTRDAFVELVMLAGCPRAAMPLPPDEVGRACATFREDNAFVEMGENDNLIVQRLAADPDAAGIFGFSYLDQNADRLRAARIDGVEPGFETIASGAYPVSRPLYLYIKPAHAAAVPGLRAFVAEFTGERAIGPDGYLADKGLIPLPDTDRAATRRKAIDTLGE